MPIVNLTNNGKGPRVVHVTGGGTVLIERGQTRENVDLTDGDLKALEGGPVVAAPVGARKTAPAPAPKTDEPLSLEAVLAMADDSDTPFPTFKAAAAKILGDVTPAKKAEIVEALKAKQAATVSLEG